MAGPRYLAAAALVLLASAGPSAAPLPTTREPPDVRLFFQAAGADDKEARRALDAIAGAWRDGHAGLFLDIIRFLPPSPRRRPGGSPLEEDGPVAIDGDAARPPFGRAERPPEPTPPEPPGVRVRSRLIRFLERQTGERLGDDLGRWRRWLWNRPYDPHPDYAAFKGALYAQVDPRMAEFFRSGGPPRIRLDEIDWGGVPVNGIPPLVQPAHVPAAAATWLDDDHVVFGIALGGEARAYPKRILAWHELARDRVGGVDLAIVYCTLCGTVIPYGAEVGGERRTFGTSGLLYRSNKLMFDEESMSLWSTVEGKPVIGALAGRGLELIAYPVVTTRWGEWKALHPETTVLSLETGHERDYAEGAAYRDYFATDRLMFGIPDRDDRLKNKDEVLTLLLRPRGEGPPAERRALALSARFLSRNPVHHLSFAGHDLVVVTSPEGANRVFDAGGRRFARRRSGDEIEDAEGRRWRVTEAALVGPGPDGARLPRLPARRAFWFGWHAQFPDTELVK